MEELANKLNVPLETIDDQTRALLSNLTKQLGLVARQTAPAPEERSIPPELRENRSHIPPELREQSNVPPELRASRQDSQSQRTDRQSYSNTRRSTGQQQESGRGLLPEPTDNVTDDNDDYCTSYPPPDDLERRGTTSSKDRSSVSVNYSHGRNRNTDSVTSESILASLHSDTTTSQQASLNGVDQSRLSSGNVPLKEKVQSFSNQVRSDIGSRSANSDRAGNGFIPRQLQSQRPAPGNVFDRPANQGRQGANQSRHSISPSRPLLGQRPGSGPVRPNQPGQQRKW